MDNTQSLIYWQSLITTVNYETMKVANRISSIKPYFFSELGKRIVAMRANGIDVIRLDMGSPDLPPPEPVIAALINGAEKNNKSFGDSIWDILLFFRFLCLRNKKCWRLHN